VAAKAVRITDEIVAYLTQREAAGIPATEPGSKKPKDPELAKLVSKYREAGLGLKDHLLNETHGKCAYCESKITHVDYGDIEHIVPKAVRPDLAVNLTNLTIACGVCNTNKSDYHNEKAPLVDPHDDDCHKEIVFCGWGIARFLCGARGQHTLRELELNRQPLSKRREDRFNQLGELVSSWKKEGEPAMRYARLLVIWDFANASSEYSSMCLTAIESFEVETP